MPETPRWLVRAGITEEAVAVLDQVYSTDNATAQQVLKQILQEQQEEAAFRTTPSTATNNKASLSSQPNSALNSLLHTPSHRRALTISCLLQASQQLCGFNCLMYFSATIFAMIGFTSPTLTSLIVATTNLIFTFLAFRIIDRVGRRRILLSAIPFMAAGLAVCAFAFAHIKISTSTSPSTPSTTQQQPSSNSSTTIWSSLLLLSLALYTSTYALSLGTIPWQQSELFPLRVRSLGSSLATATNWSCNTVVGLTFLPMMQALGPSSTFACYAGVCVLAWGAVWVIYPETAGLSLEEVGGLLKEGWGVEESLRRWEGRRGRRGLVED